MKPIQSIFLVLVAISALSCRKENSEEIDQEKIWTDYRVVINHEINKVVARTTFKNESQVGENLKLGDKASVNANGTNLEWSGIYNWYEKEISNTTQVEFIFTDNEESLHYGTVNIDTTISYDSSIANNDSLKKATIQFIPWANANALSAGEVVNLVIKQGEVTDAIRTDSVNATGVYLTTSSLNLFQLGDAEAHFEKWTPGSMTQATSAGGLTWGHYISRTKAIKIVAN